MPLFLQNFACSREIRLPPAPSRHLSSATCLSIMSEDSFADTGSPPKSCSLTGTSSSLLLALCPSSPPRDKPLTIFTCIPTPSRGQPHVRSARAFALKLFVTRWADTPPSFVYFAAFARHHVRLLPWSPCRHVLLLLLLLRRSHHRLHPQLSRHACSCRC